MGQTPPDTEQGSEGSEKSEEPTLPEEISSLLSSARSHRRRFSRAINLLKELSGKQPAAADYEQWLDVYRSLDGYELGVDDVDDQRERVVARIGAMLDKLRIKTRMKFLTKLKMLASKDDIEVEKISESPLVLYLAPLTFEVDFEDGGITMLYGHEQIDELSIDAADLLEARHSAVEKMKNQSIASEEFFDRLRAAYRTILVADGAEAGQRVDLVDVLVPLSMLGAKKKDLRKKGTEALEPFPRYLLAKQLAQLRRDGLLEKDGLRLDLGAATGGTTRDKTNVLYIPIGANSGQYYGSLKFE